MSNETNCNCKVEYYFLKTAAERFASDLSSFCNYAKDFSDEQLVGIVAYSDSIETKINFLRKELERRVNK